MKFINREQELELLNEEYNHSESSFVIIYGRRRTGKTTLINQFLKNKKSLYFFADTQNENGQINRLKSLVAELLQDKFLEKARIDSWDSIFEYFVEKIDESEKVIIAIDEFQNLVKSNKNFSSIFQRIYDTLLQKKKNIMIILCGSLISMMYSETLAYSSPLYGRRTSQIKLKEIDFKYYNQFYVGLNNIELIKYYSVTGGIPKYIEQFNKSKSLYSSIKKEILNKNKFLYYEPRFLLRDEVSDVSTYFSILTVIAEGNHKIGRISSKLAVQAHSLTPYLRKLIDLDLVEKQVPITESNPEKSRKGLYFIKDNFLRFWFRFIFPFQSYLELNESKYVEERIADEFDYHVSYVFEELSRKFIYSMSIPFIIQKCGRWWNKDNEIDVVALSNNNEILFGECKWSKKHVGLSILKKLKEKSLEVKWGTNTRKEFFCLFSKSGFSKELIELSKSDNSLFLVDINNL